MKDNEIIKALECCVHIGENENCNKCKYNQEYLHGSSLLMNALDLINRQKAEIERYLHSIKLLENDVQTAKSEARKELAERLKKSIKKSVDDAWHSDGNGIYDAECVLDDIDNLLKEMEGEEDV